MDRAVDDLGIDLADIRIADAETVGDAGAIVLDHRVGLDREHPDEIGGAFLLEVDDGAALIAIEDEEAGGDAVFLRAPIERVGSPSGGSILMISAPRSPSIMVQNGPELPA